MEARDDYRTPLEDLQRLKAMILSMQTKLDLLDALCFHAEQYGNGDISSELIRSILDNSETVQ